MLDSLDRMRLVCRGDPGMSGFADYENFDARGLVDQVRRLKRAGLVIYGGLP
jgi:hypothetical protein